MHKFIRNFSNQITDFHVISDCKLLGIHQKIYLRSHTAEMHSTSFPRHQSNQNSLLTFSISYIVLKKNRSHLKFIELLYRLFHLSIPHPQQLKVKNKQNNKSHFQSRSSSYNYLRELSN